MFSSAFYVNLFASYLFYLLFGGNTDFALPIEATVGLR